MQRIPLKFAPGPLTTLVTAQRNGDLAATIRYGDEKNIEKGDRLAVLSARRGTIRGSASVEAAREVPVRNALDVVDAYGAIHGANSTERLISRLSDHYDAPIYTSTTVKTVIMDPMLNMDTV